jgi:SIR2-like protein
VSFASLGQPEIGPLIDRMGAARDLTLLVGAGASMEAGLPSWPRLVELLLESVAEQLPGLGADERKAWAEGTIARDDLLGAGAVVAVMAGDPVPELVYRRLYGGQGPAAFAPGPIAGQVAALKALWGERLEILTTNYDDLLEEALIAAGTAPSNVRSYVLNREPGTRAPGTIAVTHLHGLAGRSGPAKGIVLTEEDYHRMQRGTSWQEQLVTARLQESTCLFVGMSLADPNLIRYLYGYKASGQPRHAAIFVRQGEAEVPVAVREAMEEAARRRWGRCGVEAVFVDHFADAAQLLYEIGLRKTVGAEAYRPVGERAGELIAAVEDGFAPGDQEVFARRQIGISNALRGLVSELILRTLELAGIKTEERFGLALWVMTADGRSLTGWAHSDRAQQDPATVSPVPVGAASEWVSVRAVCQGTTIELDRPNYSSRWIFVRGLPLVLESPTRLPIGVLTISSTRAGADSALTKLPEGAAATLNSALQQIALRLVTVIADPPGEVVSPDPEASEGARD